MQAEHASAAKQTIQECLYLNIATVTPEGQPWNTPVYFTFDAKYNFYWGSAKAAVHSENIRQNPAVFLTIYPYTETAVGVYIQGEAFELEDASEITEVLKILSRNGTPSENKATDFLGSSPLRMYKAVPRKVYISSPETAEKYHGLWVDYRAEVLLS